MARDHDEVPEHVTAALHLVEQERRQLARVVEQLLELSRLDHGSIEIERVVVDLRPIVGRAIEAVRATSGEVEIRLRAPGEPLLASIDTAVFERMLLALVAGAVRRDHRGGPIDIDLRQPRGARSVEHPSVRLTVRDHGSAPTIHGPARAEDGDAHDRSVDLHLVRRLVELHGGHLTVEHPTDGGTLVAVFVAGG
jgi:two-component system CheB/CheR fusion protein